MARTRVYNTEELNPKFVKKGVSLSYEMEDSRTDQGFYQPIDKTVQGFIATGRNVLSLRQPVQDYDYAEGDNFDERVTGEGTPFRDIYPPDIADVSQSMHDNDQVIGKSVSAVREKAELDAVRAKIAQESSQQDKSDH